MQVLNVKQYKVQCRHCGAELVFNKGDVKEDFLETDRWIVCPVCKKKRHLGALCFYEVKEDFN